MTRAAGSRRMVVRVEQHNGNEINGELTYQNDSDWKVYIRELPVSYKGVDPGTYGGEQLTGKQIQSIVTAIVETPTSPLTRGIKPTMRMVTTDGRKMNVVNVFDGGGSNTDLTIQVKELDI